MYSCFHFRGTGSFRHSVLHCGIKGSCGRPALSLLTASEHLEFGHRNFEMWYSLPSLDCSVGVEHRLAEGLDPCMPLGWQYASLPFIYKLLWIMMLMFVFTAKEVFSLPLAAASHSLNKVKRDSCTFHKSFQKAQHGSFICSLQTPHPTVTGQLNQYVRWQLPVAVRQRS